MFSITAVGNCGRNPELRYFESGKSRTTVSIACQQYGKDTPPIWLELEFWGRSAETIANYAKKGTKLAVSGSAKEEQWTDKATGVERKKLICNVDRFEFCGGRSDSDDGSGSEKPNFDDDPF